MRNGAGDLKTLTVGVADEPDTRVGFDEANSFYWHKGDRIGGITAAGFKEMVIGDQYHKQSSGVFTGGSNKTNLETLNISGGTFNGAWGFYSYGDDAKSL